VIGSEAKTGIVTATYTDFLGQTHTQDINVTVSDNGPNHVLVINNGTVGTNPWDKEAFCKLETPMVAGKKYVIKATMRCDNNGTCALWPRWDASSNRDQWGNSADIQYLDTYNVTTTYEELTWTCTANYPHDVLLFAIGKLGGNVYIDDVSCMEVGGFVEMVANGSFESDDISNWSVLSWTGQTLKVIEDATSGIKQVTVTERPDVIYDLSGRRVTTPQKGVYIVNGKAVIF
jgi:hypothetical protein